ncbi:shikimate kinase [Tenuibacillus multivorans]|uniref:Shikimate kinase n=1 Tax=Tenuibacillus multivorans TaxID=237069 RepID=A0A1G9Z8V8_9BACI|nr:shikimate kinase [Tenuibacillus multivorans]GEL77346.1 shikimate kinase [Tenuibacillus multivorans]SDN17862.1 shikimate kinase [Tenuibacillus multivorans]
MKPIALIGFMGSGKTTVGQALSNELNHTFLDTDRLIESHTKKSIPQLFETYGEAFFREQETETLKNLSSKHLIVIATGGGIVEREENRLLLQEEFLTIFLETQFESIVKRIGEDSSRPLWQQSLKERQLMFDKRQELYRQSASLSISTDGRSVQEVVQQIMLHINL